MRLGGRNQLFVGLVVVGVLVGCRGDSTGGDLCGNGVMDPGETPATCPVDSVYPCNDDGWCDPGESCAVCFDDCCGVTCEIPPSRAEHRHLLLIERVAVAPNLVTGEVAGVDVDGDGERDNRFVQLLTWLVEKGVIIDLDLGLNDSIASGEQPLIASITTSDQGFDLVNVRLFRGEAMDATPLFDGTDEVRVAPQVAGYLCGDWVPPVLETSPSDISLSFTLPGLGSMQLMLSSAQMRTVDDPASAYFQSSAVLVSEWTDVMVGGGLSLDEIDRNLIPTLVQWINDRVAEGGASVDALVSLFDGTCLAMDEVAGCEDVVSGVGYCDDTAVPPVITETEVRCNAELQARIAPDVDSDGDGEPDLLSLGFRILRAVPVTVVE